MIDLAEMARRSPQPVQHWILSWRESEQPTTAQADEAVRMFLARDGPRRPPSDLCAPPRHPQLARPRRGEPGQPRRRRSSSPSTRASTTRSRTARSLGSSSGSVGSPSRIALYDVRPDGRDRARSAARAGRAPAVGSSAGLRGACRRAERRADRASKTPRRSSGRPKLARAARSLAAKGIRFEKKGSGALLWVGDQPVKASAAGRDCSMSALQKRLGEYVPGPTVTTPPVRSAPPRARVAAAADVHRGAAKALPGARRRQRSECRQPARGVAPRGRAPPTGTSRHLPRVMEG